MILAPFNKTKPPVHPRVRFKLMCGLNLEFIPYKGQAMTEQQMPANALTARVKATTDKLVQRCIIVLDAQSVLNAPEEAYVSIE